MRRILLLVLTAFVHVAPASARDRVMYFDFKDAIALASAQKFIDGTVSFYLAGQSTPATISELGEGHTSRRTSSMSKTEKQACEWVMLSELAALQNDAKSHGANAVIGIVSNYNQQVYANDTKYECHVGSMMTGVALKGTYAKVSDH